MSMITELCRAFDRDWNEVEKLRAMGFSVPSAISLVDNATLLKALKFYPAMSPEPDSVPAPVFNDDYVPGDLDDFVDF
jgi:hypothetical protein